MKNILIHGRANRIVKVIVLLMPIVMTIGIFLMDDFYAYEKEPRHLVQTTTEQEDLEALVYLNLMQICPISSENYETTYELVKNTAVRINVNGHYGSGSIYRITTDKIIIVTNKHILNYWNEYSEVVFTDNTSHGTEYLGVDDEFDVGFLSVSIDDFDISTLLKMRSICYNQDVCRRMNKGQKVFTLDIADNQENPIPYNGKIEDVELYIPEMNQTMLHIKAYGKPGMSGAGLFDFRGYYLGMTTGGTEEDDLAAVNAEEIERIYQKITREK